MVELELTVSEVRDETSLIRGVRLQPQAGASLPPFPPGAHLQVSVPGLSDPRCYSLITLDATSFQSPAEYRLGVRLEAESSGGSRYMHALQAGDTLKVKGPKNDFPLHEADASAEAPTVLIAGGIGITPIAAMATALKAAGRPFVLHYSGRSRDQLAYADELYAQFGEQLVLHCDDDPSCCFNLAALLDSLDTAQHLYICGPKGMIDALIEGSKTRGWPADHVHFELFASAAPQAGDQAFEVELAQSGQVFTIPADKTILDVLEEAGCDTMYDCKRGECGVCTVAVLEGEPDHRDYVQTDAERAAGKTIQICISRSKSPRLLLDL